MPNHYGKQYMACPRQLHCEPPPAPAVRLWHQAHPVAYAERRGGYLPKAHEKLPNTASRAGFRASRSDSWPHITTGHGVSRGWREEGGVECHNVLAFDGRQWSGPDRGRALAAHLP